jgi:hypothetical protein
MANGMATLRGHRRRIPRAPSLSAPPRSRSTPRSTPLCATSGFARSMSAPCWMQFAGWRAMVRHPSMQRQSSCCARRSSGWTFGDELSDEALALGDRDGASATTATSNRRQRRRIAVRQAAGCEPLNPARRHLGTARAPALRATRLGSGAHDSRARPAHPSFRSPLSTALTSRIAAGGIRRATGKTYHGAREATLICKTSSTHRKGHTRDGGSLG